MWNGTQKKRAPVGALSVVPFDERHRGSERAAHYEKPARYAPAGGASIEHGARVPNRHAHVAIITRRLGHVDERAEPQRPDLVAAALIPDYALGPHTASLGITFAQAASLPAPFDRGVFVAQHGSWNRKPKSGYKVIFVPFSEGKPSGLPVDVLTGFLNEKEEAQGRPVGVIHDANGALLVSDDVGNVIWRVTPQPTP